ncbi:MAG: NAD(P)/FAD-dependent oxidoreductase [Flammeovirgaceae bacterium]|nr:NAD(P)/FAD-dependent oxidoreductase [Flammeovirgaceae bacterium]
MYDLIVIGGGAAGFFGAIQCAELNRGMKILILEKTTKLLTKVKVSGGGRCNVTHHCFDPVKLSRHYPRGEKFLKEKFKQYQAEDVVKWFNQKGVKLKTEQDGRMFPVTDDSMTIITCFLTEAEKRNIRFETSKEVVSISKDEKGFVTSCSDGETYLSKKILVAIGGHPQSSAYDFLRQAGHTTTKLIPSLFTFNDPSKSFIDLMGVSVPNAEVRIATTKFSERGPVLITHWGLSGPAVIKLSAWAAEYLFQKNYTFKVLINWTGTETEESIKQKLIVYKSNHGKQTIQLNPLYELPSRLWVRLCERSLIDAQRLWQDISQKSFNKLIENLIRCEFSIRGKTTFKEEFVTCGGVDLGEIENATLESKKLPGLYFAGEVLSIDGETGGFNFQAAWTTAYLAARSIANRLGF